MIILIIALTIFFDVVYHKIFHVVYFGFEALAKEWFICFILAVVVVGMILK